MIGKRLLKAIVFAAEKHRGQRRKSREGVPYINHPIAVAWFLADVGGIEAEDVLIAAVLHDTLEDTETTPDELAAAFGPFVLRLVEEVTDDKSLPKAQRKQLQIVHASGLSTGAALIRLADKIANVQDLGRGPPQDWSTDRIREYLDWAEEVIRNCPDVNRPLRARFAEVVHEGREALSGA
jgi:guanosine-3',5'-bis(diphosphate) 3'-pyrophosphohydrolase